MSTFHLSFWRYDWLIYITALLWLAAWQAVPVVASPRSVTTTVRAWSTLVVIGPRKVPRANRSTTVLFQLPFLLMPHRLLEQSSNKRRKNQYKAITPTDNEVTNCEMNQSEFLPVTCNLLRVGWKTSMRVLSPQRNNHNRVITFASHFKSALFLYLVIVVVVSKLFGRCISTRTNACGSGMFFWKSCIFGKLTESYRAK